MRFINNDNQQHFESEGYVVTPLLNRQSCELLLQLFGRVQEAEGDGMKTALHRNSYEQNKEISNQIFDLAWPAIEAVMDDVVSYAATFLTKYPGDRGLLDYHQDVGLVDEEKDFSINIWIPLVDVNEENGAVSILRQSHRLFPSVRANTFSCQYLPFVDELKPFAKTLEMKAGEALFYDHRLFHGSLPNRTTHPRVAVVMGATRRDAPLIYYFSDAELQRECKLEAYSMSAKEFQDMVFDRARFVTGSLRPQHLLPYSKPLFTTRVYSMTDVLNGLAQAQQPETSNY